MPKKRVPIEWTPRPVHYLFETELQRAARLHRIEVRTKEATPCARCGRESTVCEVGPPTRWLCQACSDQSLAELREAVASQEVRR